MKKTLATLAIVGMLALTGCAKGEDDANTGDETGLRPSVIELPDGREVTCVKYNNRNYVGGVTCDWDGAK